MGFWGWVLLFVALFGLLWATWWIRNLHFRHKDGMYERETDWPDDDRPIY